MSRGARIKPEDVLGKRFGSWTVIAPREPGKYLCKCDCGNKSVIKGFRLVNGSATRCKRCAARARGKMDTLIGQKIGMLTVLERCECPPQYAENTASWFLCRCDCGNEVAKRGFDLKSGKAFSCGCARRPYGSSEGEDEMPTYHVGTSPITGAIYAGRAKDLGDGLEWITKSEVTNEAVNAVAAHLLLKIEQDEGGGAYYLKTRDGRHLRLKLEVSDHKPSWLSEEGEE
jgi:hypothetical protein